MNFPDERRNHQSICHIPGILQLYLQSQRHVQLLHLVKVPAQVLIGLAVRVADRPAVPLHGAADDAGGADFQVLRHFGPGHGERAAKTAVKAR